MTPEDIERAVAKAPQANHVRVFFCGDPACFRPHVVLFNADDSVLAHFVQPDARPDGSGFLKDLQDAAYRSAVLRRS